MSALPPARSEEPPIPLAHWYGLGILFLVYLANFVDRQILSILANDIKADLAISDAQLGFLYGTAFAIFYALFGIPLGRLADRTNRARLLALALLLWSGMTVLSGFARNLWQLSLARVGVGVGEAAANPCAYSLIADWFPGRLRATALGIYSAGLFVGSGLSLLLGALVVESWNQAFAGAAPFGLAGWQAAFIAVGMPGLVLAVLVWHLPEPRRQSNKAAPATPGTRPAPAPHLLAEMARIVPPFTLLWAARRGRAALAGNLGAAALCAMAALGLSAVLGNPAQFTFLAIGCYAVFSWASALRAEDQGAFAATFGKPAFVAIVLAYAAVCYIGYTISYWAAPYAERSLGLGKTELGWLIGAPNALGGFAGVLAGGWLADRLFRLQPAARLLVPALALLLPVPLLLVGYGTRDTAVFLICNVLAQMATASALGASAAASQALVPAAIRGTASAIFLLGPTLIGLAFGPFMAGYVSGRSGDLALGVKSCLIAVPLGLLALWIGWRRHPRGEPASA